MERPPRSVEYICLWCGVQGLTKVPAVRDERDDELEMQGDSSLICPKCGGTVLCIEREVAFPVSMSAFTAKP